MAEAAEPPQATEPPQAAETAECLLPKNMAEAAEGASSDEEQPSLPSSLSRRFTRQFDKVRNVQIPGYGTMAGEPPPVDKLRWFARGAFLPLTQELSAQYGAYIILVCTMVTVPSVGPVGYVQTDKWFPCDLKSEYIATYTGSIICEYTKTYVWSFPQLALASLLLLLGRDYVQKRFYYFMLKNGGVMSFVPRPLLRDSIVAVNLWAFAHFIFFCLLVAWRLWLGGIDPSKAATAVAKATMAAASNPGGPSRHKHMPVKDANDSEGLQVLISLVIFLGLPGVLFILKLIDSYNIEITLVPLSEYIRDNISTSKVSSRSLDKLLEDAESDEENPTHLGGTDLAKLIPMNDTCVRGLVQVYSEALQTHQVGQNRYEHALELYVQQGWYKLIKEPEPIQLLDGLWPAPFVTAREGRAGKLWDGRAGDWTFNAVWQTYRQMTMGVCLAILACQVIVLCMDVRRCFTQHWQALFSFVGEIINIYFVGQILYQFYLAKSPA